MVDDNGRDDGLACSWHTWTKQYLLALDEPVLEFVRIQQPLPGSFLAFSNEVTLLRSIVDWAKPVDDELTLFFLFMLLLSLV